MTGNQMPLQMQWACSLAHRIVMVLALCACSQQKALSAIPHGVHLQRANLHAFARLYGVIRWFHPSDAAAMVDWDQFAVEGVRRVMTADSLPVLRARLAETFAAVAPTMHIIGPHEHFPDEPALRPGSALTELVAWQHRGFGDSVVAAAGYVSKRLHRDQVIAVPNALFAALSQTIDATPYRGAMIRLRGRLRTASHAQGRLWLRVDRRDIVGFFDNMEQHPVVSSAWSDGEIIGNVAPDATSIVFGVIKRGVGTTWFDDLKLSTSPDGKTWRDINIDDGGFEAIDPLLSWHPGIGRQNVSFSNEGWKVTVDHDAPASGAGALRIEPVTKVVTDELFTSRPTPGETIDVDLGSGLQARVPIALYSRNGRTIGDNPDGARRTQSLATPSRRTTFDAAAGLADVIVLWNVFEHFWPYQDVVSFDGNGTLDAALLDALDDRSVDDHIATLERLGAAAPDGHVSTVCPGQTLRVYPPFAMDLIEGHLVVTASEDQAVERGDVIITLDHQPALQTLAAEETLVSGSPQWKSSTALRRIAGGLPGTRVLVQLQRGDTRVEVEVARIERAVSERRSHDAIVRFDDGVYYIDLTRASLAEVEAIVSKLATAPGVVFDVRGRPNANHDVLSHLVTKERLPATAWEAIPLVIRPDHPSTPAEWADTSNENMPSLRAQQPHIDGRIAFLTGPRAISYAETVMSLVEYYRLGEIVGSATAGTNGDIAQVVEPTGCDTIFTGRRVTKPDGSRHHLVGIQPTILVQRTIAGVRAGRDEILERGLDYVRNAR